MHIVVMNQATGIYDLLKVLLFQAVDCILMIPLKIPKTFCKKGIGASFHDVAYSAACTEFQTSYFLNLQSDVASFSLHNCYFFD